jgi:hypothetical protein
VIGNSKPVLDRSYGDVDWKQWKMKKGERPIPPSRVALLRRPGAWVAAGGLAAAAAIAFALTR